MSTTITSASSSAITAATATATRNTISSRRLGTAGARGPGLSSERIHGELSRRAGRASHPGRRPRSGKTPYVLGAERVELRLEPAHLRRERPNRGEQLFRPVRARLGGAGRDLRRLGRVRHARLALVGLAHLLERGAPLPVHLCAPLLDRHRRRGTATSLLLARLSELAPELVRPGLVRAGAAGSSAAGALSTGRLERRSRRMSAAIPSETTSHVSSLRMRRWYPPAQKAAATRPAGTTAAASCLRIARLVPGGVAHGEADSDRRKETREP